jgi:hypothetical protein
MPWYKNSKKWETGTGTEFYPGRTCDPPPYQEIKEKGDLSLSKIGVELKDCKKPERVNF